MTHHERAADAARAAGVTNPGRLLLALDRFDLVVKDTGDATRLVIVSAELEAAVQALRDDREGDWRLGNHLLRSEPYRRIMSRFDESREAEWLKQARQAKGAA